MTSFMLYGLGDAHERPDVFPVEPADISRKTLEGDGPQPEPPADITRLRAASGDTATVPPAPVPVGLRVAVKASAYVLVLLAILGLIGVMVGLVVRIWSWGLGFE